LNSVSKGKSSHPAANLPDFALFSCCSSPAIQIHQATTQIKQIQTHPKDELVSSFKCDSKLFLKTGSNDKQRYGNNLAQPSSNMLLITPIQTK
jgi:hypothetical protein